MTSDPDRELEPIDIIYIMGSGRSGSTLLSSMLGSQLNIISAGEVYNYKNLFESAVSDKRICSCGEKLDECNYWRKVRQNVVNNTGHELVDLKDTRPEIFKENNFSVFSAIKEISGKSIIVDSSKRHYRLKLLLKSKLFRVVIVHLIRDARAYSYSSLLTARKNGKSDMVFYKKLMEWQKKNLGIKAIYGRKPGYIQMRYEDLVSDHASQLSRVTEAFNLPLDGARLFDPEMNESHVFSGNSRFISKGLDEIKLDTRYLVKLSSSQWLVATALVAPALFMFNYPVFKRSAPV